MSIEFVQVINAYEPIKTSGEYDEYPQTHVYPFVARLWNNFLTTHPQFVDIVHDERCKEYEYMVPSYVTFEEARVTKDTVRVAMYEGSLCTLGEITEHIYERAKGLADNAAVAMYMSWFEKHRREIKNDFGAIVEKKPEVVNESQNTEEQLQQAA